MKFSLLINMKMPTIVGIFIFISREMFISAMFSKIELSIISDLRLLAGHISCSVELSVKTIVNPRGLVLQLSNPRP